VPSAFENIRAQQGPRKKKQFCRRRGSNSALQHADQVHHAEGKVAAGQTWFAPLVTDTEAGFGGTLTRDRKFCTGECTAEDFYRIQGGIESAIARGLDYAPYADNLALLQSLWICSHPAIPLASGSW
jgi:isocitrate lyase